MTDNIKEINDAKQVLSRLIPIVNQAESLFKKARFWGFLDLFGGEFISSFFKHTSLNNAKTLMSQIDYYLKVLQKELKEIVSPVDFTMNISNFAIFADFFFDGLIADVYMQSKIQQSLDHIQSLKSELLAIQNKLYSI